MPIGARRAPVGTPGVPRAAGTARIGGARLAAGEWRNGRRAGLRSRCRVSGVEVRPLSRLRTVPVERKPTELEQSSYRQGSPSFRSIWCGLVRVANVDPSLEVRVARGRVNDPAVALGLAVTRSQGAELRGDGDSRDGRFSADYAADEPFVPRMTAIPMKAPAPPATSRTSIATSAKRRMPRLSERAAK